MVLEITPTAPLVHGAGSRGNETIMRTSQYLVEVDDPEMPGRRTTKRIDVPVVSGSALRATLREHACGHLFEALGMADGTIGRDQLRLLLKGGKNDSGGASVSLDEHRRLRGLFPVLAVFGSMDGGMPIRGQLSVSPVRPFVRELVDAGLVPRHIGTVEVAQDGEVASRPMIEVHAGREPVPLHLIRTREEYFRHDMRTSPHFHLLEGQAVAQIEDQSVARKGKVAGKDDRREANESMPHSFQAIAAGTPMVAELRLAAATQVEWETLAYAIGRWIAHGAHLGGGRGRGHGACSVRCAGALVYQPAPGTSGTSGGTAISIERVGSQYMQHIREHADALRAELTGGAT